MNFVAGINAFRREAAEKVGIEMQATAFLENWHANLFSTTRVNRGFINDNIAFF